MSLKTSRTGVSRHPGQSTGVSKARLVITAVVLEGRPAAQVAAEHGVSRSWLYELLARYRDEDEAAFEPRSKRPRTSPRATRPEVVEQVVRLRKELSEAGPDAGPATLAWHLQRHHQSTVSVATIARILTREGLVTRRRRSDRKPPTSASKPSCPTNAGSPTSPITASPTAPTSRSSPGWMTTPATSCTAQRTPP